MMSSNPPPSFPNLGNVKPDTAMGTAAEQSNFEAYIGKIKEETFHPVSDRDLR